MESFETFKLVMVPDSDKLSRDKSGVVHYTRILRDWSGESSGMRVEYCTDNTVVDFIDRAPDSAITCLRCLGAYG